ncbi:ParB/RepB/Spo0J family partition protein [Arthrobacter bambusae]|uniref:ParB/RepB/Spo0J family partition protein n=1 Tax=Arthrobacter bambusae TaxID=1338426 RepID=UPI001F50FB83|nr:ParB N-terminal domain-containing protein [Arthrobacter bambusae]
MASIKEHGVLVPVVAHRTGDGNVHVLMGQRRTLGALEAGRNRIPVHIVDNPEEADRLATQVVENDHRSALTDADRAEAFHQMSLLGVSASVIARKMGAKKALVDTALKVKSNSTAAQALEQGLTLEQSAVIEEFADAPEAAAALERLAMENPGGFAHQAQRLRDERRNAARIAEATAEAQAKGLTVLQEDPGYYDYKGAAAAISKLTTADGVPLTDEDADAVYLGTGYSGLYTRFAVADWKARGLRKEGKAPAGGMTEEEKAARREVIENNKAMDSAEVVRRDFVKALLSRKALPKNAHRFIAHHRPRQLHPGQGPEQDRPDSGTAGHRRWPRRVQGLRGQALHQTRNGHPRHHDHRLRREHRPHQLAEPPQRYPLLPHRTHGVGIRTQRRGENHPHRPRHPHRGKHRRRRTRRGLTLFAGRNSRPAKPRPLTTNTAGT